MNKFLIPLIAVGAFPSGSTRGAQESLSPADRQQIAGILDSLVQAINTGNTEELVSLISPEKPGLQEEVKNGVKGVTRYKLNYDPLERKIKLLDIGKVRVKAGFIASGRHWRQSGFPIYFTFERRDDRWFITDTDFHKVLSTSSVHFSVDSFVEFMRKMPNLKDIASDSSLWSLLLSNGVTIVLALTLEWSLPTLLLIYWIQSVEIGIFSVVRILQPADGSGCSKYGDALSFILHYGMFHLAYLAFILSALVGEGSVQDSVDIIFIAVSSVLFFVNHLFSYLKNRPKETKKQNRTALMVYPYVRIVPMHLTIVLGGLTGAGLLLFLVLKTFADVVMHSVQHAMLREGAEAKDTPNDEKRA